MPQRYSEPFQLSVKHFISIIKKFPLTSISPLTPFPLQAEVRENPSLAQCRVHTLSPGMILTDLLLDGVSSPAIKQAFNILCEQPETTAAFLAPRIRAAVARGCNSGAHIAYLTPLSALGRLATAPARLGRFFDSDGKPVYIQDERARMATKAAVRAINAARRLNSGLTMAYSLSVALCVLAVVLESGVQHG